MTAEERREIAVKAGKASGEARRKKAKGKKKERKKWGRRQAQSTGL